MRFLSAIVAVSITAQVQGYPTSLERRITISSVGDVAGSEITSGGKNFGGTGADALIALEGDGAASAETKAADIKSEKTSDKKKSVGSTGIISVINGDQQKTSVGGDRGINTVTSLKEEDSEEEIEATGPAAAVKAAENLGKKINKALAEGKIPTVSSASTKEVKSSSEEEKPASKKGSNSQSIQEVTVGGKLGVLVGGEGALGASIEATSSGSSKTKSDKENLGVKAEQADQEGSKGSKTAKAENANVGLVVGGEEIPIDIASVQANNANEKKEKESSEKGEGKKSKGQAEKALELSEKVQESSITAGEKALASAEKAQSKVLTMAEKIQADVLGGGSRNKGNARAEKARKEAEEKIESQLAQQEQKFGQRKGVEPQGQGENKEKKARGETKTEGAGAEEDDGLNAIAQAVGIGDVAGDNSSTTNSDGNDLKGQKVNDGGLSSNILSLANVEGREECENLSEGQVGNPGGQFPRAEENQKGQAIEKAQENDAAQAEEEDCEKLLAQEDPKPPGGPKIPENSKLEEKRTKESKEAFEIKEDKKEAAKTEENGKDPAKAKAQENDAAQVEEEECKKLLAQGGPNPPGGPKA